MKKADMNLSKLTLEKSGPAKRERKYGKDDWEPKSYLNVFQTARETYARMVKEATDAFGVAASEENS